MLWESKRLKSEGKILHVAPERALAPVFRKLFEYVSIDLDEKNAMMAMDVTELTFPSDSFDAVVCNHVLEHVYDDRKALSELYRVLKKGGWGSLQVPIKGEVTFEDGRVVKTRFEKKSGNVEFDRSVMRAIQKANPLPPLPPGVREPLLTLGIRFQ